MLRRMITAVIGMNCTMPWQRVRVAPFTSILDTATLDEMAFDRQGQLWHLWDSLMDQVYVHVRAICTFLAAVDKTISIAFDWQTLPSEEKQTLLIRARQALFGFLGDSDERLRTKSETPTSSSICFHMAFQTALLLIHRPFICESDLGPLQQLAIRTVTAAANSITELVKDFNSVQTYSEAPPEMLTHISSAAVIYLLNATSGKGVVGRRAANKLAVCLDALVSMRSRWNIRATTSIRFIQELAHRWKVVWALPLSLSYPLDQTALQFASPGLPIPAATHEQLSIASDFASMAPPIQVLDQYYNEMHDDNVGSMALKWLFDATDEDFPLST